MGKKKCPVPRHWQGQTLPIKGQYELVDRSIIQRIIDALELEPTDTVLDIGAGTGVLTFPIKERVEKVIPVEIDKKLCTMLPGAINIDFLKMDLKEFPPSVKIVSNLPYYITTPIITRVVNKFNLMVFTMQEEVARRLTAEPGTKDYGAISVFVQFYTKPEIICPVPKKCFRPIPKVDSCVVRFKKRETKIDFPEDFLFNIVRRSFSSRRKMLRNTLKGFGSAIIDFQRRAETLSVTEFCQLAGELWKKQKG